MAAGLRIELLAGGDVSKAPAGAHLVLEASGGALMHALRMPEGLLALRGGTVRAFQAMRSLPSAALVRYPPPLGPSCDAEMAQAVERARGLVGLGAAEVSSFLVRSGAVAQELSAGGEALAAELLCSFCVTGAARSWRVADAYRAERRRAFTGGEAAPALPVHMPLAAPSPAATLGACSLAAGGRQSSPAPSPASAPTASPLGRCSEGQSESPVMSGSSSAEGAGAGSPSLSPTGAEDGNTSMKAVLQEKALATAVHLGLRGSAARAAGAVAAFGCEGYALYREIMEHGQQLDHRNISEGQYQERVCESAVSSSGRALGGLAGAAAGQAAIPVPIIGAVVGGVVGAACGGMHANSLVRGAWRLSGAKAKGGGDLVRCIEHQPEKVTAAGAGNFPDRMAPQDGLGFLAPAASQPLAVQQREEEEEPYLL